MVKSIHNDKCSNCEATESKTFWDYDDNSVLCDKCHSKIGDTWADRNKKPKKQEKSEQKDEEFNGVGGWLAFFVFGLGVSVLINLFSGLTDIAGIIDLGLPSTSAVFLILLDILMFGGIIGMIIYAIICITQLKSNAVTLAKKYLIIMLISSITGFILMTYSPDLYNDETSFSGFNNPIRGLIFSLIWLAYFSNSKRVKNTYPESERKSYLIDNILFYSLIVLDIIVFLLGIVGANATP